MTTPASTEQKLFPFTLANLAGFTMKLKSGQWVKVTITKDGFGTPASKGTVQPRLVSPQLPAHYAGSATTTVATTARSLSDYCSHKPDPYGMPIWRKGKLGLWIGDAAGARAMRDAFDLVIDAGSVITIYESDHILRGDPLAAALLKHVTLVPTRVLKVSWMDRQDPDLKPEFWPDLASRLMSDDSIKKVMTACQGGHGRSGTSLVCLLMCLSDYSPAQAIIHLRANHCPRAIESVLQHEYISKVGALLGREDDIKSIEKITDYRKEFLSWTDDASKPYRENLVKGNLTTDTKSRKNDPFCDPTGTGCTTPALVH